VLIGVVTWVVVAVVVAVVIGRMIVRRDRQVPGAAPAPPATPIPEPAKPRPDVPSRRL
jgi:hypothetical protein